MGIEVIVSYAAAILLLFIIVKIFAWPIKIFIRLCINGVLGAILLCLVNLAGNMIGFSIGINVVTSLIAGFFGIPGVIFLIIYKILL